MFCAVYMTLEFVLWYDLQSEKHDGRVSSKPGQGWVQRRSRNWHMMRNHQHSKKGIFQNNILVTIVSPWAPYPGVRWSSWHQKPHPAPSQIQIIRNKTEFPQNSPSMSELLTFTGFCQNRPYNTSQNPERFFRKFVLMTWLLKRGMSHK